MPKETIWHPHAEADTDPRRIDIKWGVNELPGVFINDVQVDRSAINRTIRVLRKARDQAFGRDE